LAAKNQFRLEVCKGFKISIHRNGAVSFAALLSSSSFNTQNAALSTRHVQKTQLSFKKL